MQRAFGYSRRVDWGFHATSGVFVLFAVLLAGAGQWFGAAILALVAGGVSLLIWLLRRRNAPFLVVDERGLRSPPMQLDIAWSNLKQVHVFHPPEDAESGPSLAFDVHDEAACGPGTYKPEFLKRLLDTAALPRIYLELPLLDAPIEEVMREIEARAPGKVGPPLTYEWPHA